MIKVIFQANINTVLDFEDYIGDTDLQETWPIRYDTDTELFLETSTVGGGDQSMRMEYTIGSPSLTYAGASRDLVGDWSQANFLTFWLKPDDSERRLRIRIYKNDTDYWYYNYTLEGTDSLTVTLALDDFSSSPRGMPMDPTLFTSIMFDLSAGSGGNGSGTLYFDNIKFLSNYITAIETEENSQVPLAFELYPNYPNPFNSETKIRYALPNHSSVRITVYNILGQVVNVLVDGYQKAGTHEVRWDASNVGSGIYFYELKAESIVLYQKCILVK